MVLLDALMAAVWLAVNFLLIRASWHLASALSPGESSVDRLVDALVIGLSMVIVSTIVLGLVGQLSGTALLLLVAALAYSGELLTRRPLARQSVGLAVGDAPDTPQLEPRAFLQPRSGQPTTNWFAVVWGVLLAWLVSHMIVDGLLKFPTDWDCLMYHIPMVDEWLQARSLYAPDSSYWWSPGNSEVIGLWCVAPFSGDFLIALNNLPVMVLWVASTLSVARSLGMSNAGSHFTTLAVVLVHTSFHETDDASNDLLLVASFTAAVAYLLRDLRRPRTTDVVLAGLSLGLLAGVKYFSVGYVVLVVGTWGLAALLQGKRWNACRDLALLGALAVPCGAYWYVRNVAVSGSPFYPMGLSGESPAVGYPNVGTTSLWGNPDTSRWGLVLPSLWKMTGPIHMTAVIATPAVIIALFAAAFWYPRKKVRATFERGRGPLLAALIAGCGVLLVITPFAVEDQPGTLNHLRWAYTPVRYGLPFFSLAVVGYGLVVRSVFRAVERRWCSGMLTTNAAAGQWARWTAIAGIMAVLIWQATLRFQHGSIELEIQETLLLAFNLCLIALNWKMFTVGRLTTIQRGTIAAVGGTFALVLSVALLSLRWHAEFDSHYDRFFQTAMFSDLTRSYRNVRICVLDLRHYAFFGSARERHVCRPRYLESLDDFYVYLAGRKVNYVATKNGSGQEFDLYRKAPRWLRLNPTRFQVRITGAVHTLFAYSPLGSRDSGRDLTHLDPRPPFALNERRTSTNDSAQTQNASP